MYFSLLCVDCGCVGGTAVRSISLSTYHRYTLKTIMLGPRSTFCVPKLPITTLSRRHCHSTQISASPPSIFYIFRARKTSLHWCRPFRLIRRRTRADWRSTNEHPCSITLGKWMKTLSYPRIHYAVTDSADSISLMRSTVAYFVTKSHRKCCDP